MNELIQNDADELKAFKLKYLVITPEKLEGKIEFAMRFELIIKGKDDAGKTKNTNVNDLLTDLYTHYVDSDSIIYNVSKEYFVNKNNYNIGKFFISLRKSSDDNSPVETALHVANMEIIREFHKSTPFNKLVL